jgi:hypothetical protein
MAGPQLDDGVDALVEGAAAQYNVDPNLMRAVLLQESGGNPFTPDSSAGAKGIAQFLPATLREVMGPDANPYDVPTAIAGEAKYLSQGLSEGERLGVPDPGVYAARWYNGGPRGPSEPATEGYAQSVARRYAALNANSSATSDGPVPAMGTGGGSAVRSTLPLTPISATPSAADVASLSDDDLRQLALMGTLAPDGASAAVRPPPVQLASGAGDWQPGPSGLMQGGALPRMPVGPGGGPVALSPDLTPLAALGTTSAGSSSPALPPNQYPQTPAQYTSQMMREVNANATGGLSQSSGGPASAAPAQQAQNPAPPASAPSAPAAAAGVSKLSDDELVAGIDSGKIPAPWFQRPSTAANGNTLAQNVSGPQSGNAPPTPPGVLPPIGAVDPNVAQLPPLPKGVYATLDPNGLQQAILERQRAGLPYDQQRADLDLVNSGMMRYSDGIVRAYPGGPADPQVIARRNQASSYGSASGAAAPGFTRMVVNGNAIDVPTPTAEQWFRNQYGAPGPNAPSAQPGPALGANMPATPSNLPLTPIPATPSAADVAALGGPRGGNLPGPGANVAPAAMMPPPLPGPAQGGNVLPGPALGANAPQPAPPPPPLPPRQAAPGITLGGTPVPALGYDAARQRVTDMSNDAQNAQAQLGTIQAIRGILQNAPASGSPLYTGWLADTRADIARRLAAVNIDAGPISNAANADELQKLFLQQAAQGAAGAGRGQEGVLHTFLTNYPSLETQPGALDLMERVFQMNQQRLLDRRDAVLSGWQGGDAQSELNAEAAFDKSNPATNYLHAAEIQTADPANSRAPSDAVKRAYSAVTDPDQQLAIQRLVPRGQLYFDAQGNTRHRGGAPTTPGG